MLISILWPAMLLFETAHKLYTFFAGPGRGQGFAGAPMHAEGQKRPGDFPGRDSDACKQPKQDIPALPQSTVAEGSALNVRNFPSFSTAFHFFLACL